MARTIEIDDAVWERLCEKARQLGCDAEVLAQSLLAESLQQECAQPSRFGARRAAS
jgi:lipocalin